MPVASRERGRFRPVGGRAGYFATVSFIVRVILPTDTIMVPRAR
jgi:hypothetical protein